jgi:hypothetical protein
MGIDAKQLKLFVIVPTLAKLGLYSDSAVNLLLGTCAQESRMGTYLKQINGPALGIYQVEPNSHEDIWDNYLKYRSELAGRVLGIDSRDTNNLIVNLSYATAIARIHYLRAPDPFPEHNDIEGLAHYWKRYYNSYEGKGTVEEFIDNYKRYVNV